MKLSLVMATINDSIATSFTIANAIRQLEDDKIDYEIILIDNGTVGEEFVNLKVFLEAHKRYPIFYDTYDIKGIIPPHSYGVTKATGDVIMMPDPHVVFSSHYFKTMMESIEGSPTDIVMSGFSIGEVGSTPLNYICGSNANKGKPFGKAHGVGVSCNYETIKYPILANHISGFIAYRKRFLEIGNMFPDSFVKAGGCCAEGLIIGLTNWMFGGRCFIEPKANIDHFTYRNAYGAGRSANMYLSMAVGSYLLTGDLSYMEEEYGAYNPGELEEIPEICKKDREYILSHAKYDLNYVLDHYKEL